MSVSLLQSAVKEETMPFTSRRAKLVLDPKLEKELAVWSRSRRTPAAQKERAGILLAYAGGETVSAIARQMRTNRPKVERCIQKALDVGPRAALRDLPRPGRFAEHCAGGARVGRVAGLPEAQGRGLFV